MRASLRNKIIDKNVNKHNSGPVNNISKQVLTNKFLVLDEENDSDTETIQNKLNTESVPCDDGFIEVKRNKKSKFDQHNKFNKFSGDNKKNTDANINDDTNNTDNTNNTSNAKIHEEKIVSKFGVPTSEKNNKENNDTSLPPLPMASGVSKFSNKKESKFSGQSNQSERDNDEWETQAVRKVRNRNDEQNAKQLYDEVDEDNNDLSNIEYGSNDKQLYIETKTSSQDFGNNMFLHCPWTVWIHKEGCVDKDGKPDWSEKSYTNVYEIDSIGKFWRFFNNFHLFDKKENQFFIMRKKIKPIWEDNENRKGGICSIKFESFTRPGKIDVGTEMMTSICLLIMNETFLLNNEEINGVSYAVKNRSVFIKIWSKNYTTNMPDKIPTSLMIKFDTVLRNLDRSSHYSKQKPENRISIQYKSIKPEDET